MFKKDLFGNQTNNVDEPEGDKIIENKRNSRQKGVQ
jgi:hypothetical protein